MPISLSHAIFLKVSKAFIMREIRAEFLLLYSSFLFSRFVCYLNADEDASEWDVYQELNFLLRLNISYCQQGIFHLVHF